MSVSPARAARWCVHPSWRETLMALTNTHRRRRLALEAALLVDLVDTAPTTLRQTYTYRELAEVHRASHHSLRRALEGLRERGWIRVLRSQTGLGTRVEITREAVRYADPFIGWGD